LMLIIDQMIMGIVLELYLFDVKDRNVDGKSYG